MLGFKYITRSVDRLIARRFEAAETTRLNKAHWRGATDDPVNVDLYSDLDTLRMRATFEARRNPMIEGVIDTYSKDCSGREGPMLRVISSDPKFNKAAQDFWYEWSRCPDIAGKLGLADFLRLWIRNLFTAGEFIAQRVTDNTDPAVSLRLKTIHPRRLKTPPQQMGDPMIAMGVKRTPEGKPISYFILQPLIFMVYQLDTGKYDEIPADQLLHEFITVEDDQVRGIPWLASSLQSMGDLRDYDAQVLDAARQAADSAVFWYTDHPDAPFVETNDIVDVERRQQQTGPPGWKPSMLTPTQPALNYIDYRSERLRDVGRGFGMPLMMVRLGSEEHNYSSARFDGEIYKRGISSTQEWIERRVLDGLVNEVLREGELYATANPDWKYAALRRRPADVELLFIWPPLPHVDPEKDAADEQTRLESGTLTFDEACARAGKDADTQIAKAAEVLKKFVASGLPLPVWMTAGMQNAGITVDADGSLKVKSKNGLGATAGAPINGPSPDESQMDFLRKVLLAFLADKTVNDVLYNVTDIAGLAQKVGLPMEAQVKADPNQAIPWLPVEDAAGRPVTGGIEKDSDGDIVGGEAEKSEATAPTDAPPENPDDNSANQLSEKTGSLNAQDQKQKTE